jgi:hypothetical protein
LAFSKRKTLARRRKQTAQGKIEQCHKLLEETSRHQFLHRLIESQQAHLIGEWRK